MSITVRTATPADIDNLVSWNAAMAWDTEHKRLDPDVLRKGTEGVFDDQRRGFYLVAELEGVPAGSLLVTLTSGWTRRCIAAMPSTGALTSSVRPRLVAE